MTSEIAVKWNHDAASKRIAFLHLECDGKRYTIEVEFKGYGERPWKIGKRLDWQVTA